MRAWMYNRVSHKLKGAGAAGGAGRSVLPPSPVLPPTQCSPNTPGALRANAGKDLQRVIGQEPDPTSLPEDTTSSTTTSSTPDKTKQPPCCIDHLPTELLCRIFMLCGDPYPRFGYPGDAFMHIESSHRRHTFYSRTVVALGHVCSRWSAVTRSYPLLWTMVDLSLPRSWDILILRLCLKYSAGLPMSLRLHEHLVFPESTSLSKPHDQTIYRRFLRLVAQNADRWSEISINVEDDDDILSVLLETPPGGYSSLERASVYNEASGRATTLRALYRRFYASQNLHSVTFWDSFEPPYLTLHDAPVGRLTSMSIQYMRDPQAIFTLLYSCPQLEVLCIEAELPTCRVEGVYDLSRRLCLPRLKILSLSGRFDWTQFLDHLLVPHLDRLDIRWDMSVSVVDMMDRSNARIRMFTVCYPSFSHLKVTVPLLQSRSMEDLQIMRYAPGGEDPFDLDPFLPRSVQLLTHSYEVAENAYQDLIYDGNRSS
ncbi:hypothetical protein EV122DRAFT_293387 [Schizophyllum commune]